MNLILKQRRYDTIPERHSISEPQRHFRPVLIGVLRGSGAAEVASVSESMAYAKYASMQVAWRAWKLQGAYVAARAAYARLKCSMARVRLISLAFLEHFYRHDRAQRTTISMRLPPRWLQMKSLPVTRDFRYHSVSEANFTPPKRGFGDEEIS